MTWTDTEALAMRGSAAAASQLLFSEYAALECSLTGGLLPAGNTLVQRTCRRGVRAST